jgi:hypothetical protein
LVPRLKKPILPLETTVPARGGHHLSFQYDGGHLRDRRRKRVYFFFAAFFLATFFFAALAMLALQLSG